MKKQFKKAAEELLELKAAIKSLKKQAAEISEKLKDLCENETTSIDGYTYQRIERPGNVQYNLIPELKMIDLDQYRKDIVVSALSVFTVLPVLTKHRGTLHRTWFALGAPLAIPIILGPTPTAWFIYTFFTTGALSHILLDNIT